MRAKINRHIFEQTRFDSGNLAQMGFVVHQYEKSGRYQVDVYRQDELKTSFYIDVDSDSREQQISVDLAKMDAEHQKRGKTNCCCEGEDAKFVLDKDGYALFYVGSGSGGYRVISSPLRDRDEDLLFDSTKLNKGDLYGLTLLRPGDYSVKELSNKRESRIAVSAVKPCKTKYVPPEALHLDMEKLSAKQTLEMQQAQGIVFRAQHHDRVVIEFEPPCNEKGPGNDPKGKVARWTSASARRAQ